MSATSNQTIVLSFDLEEFDIPQEYGIEVSKEEQFSVSNAGLMPMLDLLEKYKIKATFFITAHYAEENIEIVRKISEKHEIASHSYYHDFRIAFENKYLYESKVKLEEITGKEIKGFRIPRLAPVEKSAIQEAGYQYDSSLNPTWLPGRYNFFSKPATPFFEDKLLILPTAVVPLIRLPLFWISFKNLPLWLYYTLLRLSLRFHQYSILYFHPWEFANLEKWNLPKITKKISGSDYLNKLEKLIESAKKDEIQFSTCEQITSKIKAK